ncbi:transposase IS200 like protein [Acidithrix ferrooxidans]|uniref:Transposase IS200 like protein n=1 Tax=Acidithrix ferrooxidans TaxID=1280514 RepID=A0A0D8HDU8_9ACTN|nr:transposase IS200 like protein [Acidithrix ferrooxidans]
MVPKYRRYVMTNRVSNEIKSALIEVCTRFDSISDAFETDGDHAHLSITNAAKVALSRLVMLMNTLAAMRASQRTGRKSEMLCGGTTSGHPHGR